MEAKDQIKIFKLISLNNKIFQVILQMQALCLISLRVIVLSII